MRWIFEILLVVLVFGCLGKTSKNTSINNIPGISTENVGDRLSITGDFNGDGQSDTLKESFISSFDGKETNKYYKADFDSMVSLTIQKKPISRLLSYHLKPLNVNKDNWQLFGLAYLKNEGDLNGDGNDEVGLIVDWADWSDVNYYQVYSYKFNEWKVLLSFEIRDYDVVEIKKNKESKGFLYKNSAEELIAKTWEMGERKEKKVELMQ